MAQYTEQQALSALRGAHAAGDNAAVNEWATYLDGLKETSQAAEKEAATSYTPQQTPFSDIGSQFSSGVMGAVSAAGEANRQNMADMGQVVQEKAQAGQNPFSSGPSEDTRPQNPQQFAAYQAADTLIKPAISMIGTGATSVGQLLSNITPDAIEKPTVETFKTLAYNVGQTPWVQKALGLASESYGKYLGWAKENPAEDRQLRAAFDIAAIGAPASKALPVTSTLNNIGRKSLDSGRKAGIENKKESVWEMLKPLHPESAENAPNGMPTETRGLFNTIEPVKGPFDVEMIDVTSLVPNLKPSGNFTDSRNTIYTEIKATAQRLTTRIEKAGNPKVDIKALAGALETRATALKGETGFSLAGGTPKFADDLMSTAVKFIKESDGTTLGLLDARKQLDRYIQKHQPERMEADYVNSKKVAVSAIRNMLNDTVDAAVPSVDVKGLLRKQHIMYKAWDVTMDKSKIEARNAIGRQWQNLRRTTKLNVPTTPLALAATANAAGSFVTSGFAAYATGALAGVGAGVLGYRMLKAPATRKGIGEMLTATAKAIKASKSREMVEQLKADRVILLSVLQEMEDERERPPLKAAANN